MHLRTFHTTIFRELKRRNFVSQTFHFIILKGFSLLTVKLYTLDTFLFRLIVLSGEKDRTLFPDLRVYPHQFKSKLSGYRVNSLKLDAVFSLILFILLHKLKNKILKCLD